MLSTWKTRKYIEFLGDDRFVKTETYLKKGINNKTENSFFKLITQNS